MSAEESQWQRVEEIAAELENLDTEEAAERMVELEAEGETRTVLSLVSNWLSLTPVPPPVKAGDIIAKDFVLGEKIGEGGMGVVWKANQTIFERNIALKMIHPSLVTPALKAQFLGEMKILGQLNHPGIVTIHAADFFRDAKGVEIPFFAMELVQGTRLDHWAASRREDRPALLRVVAEVCLAVQHAHDCKVVHRDLKPANILVRENGIPVVLDFGVARLAGGNPEDLDGGFAGTPHYAAPEQHTGRDRDFRSGESVDIYAVGAILFEILSGRRLFNFPRGTSISEMRRAIVEGEKPRLAETLADCPPLLDEITSRALRRDPADRYFSIAPLGLALRRAASTLEGSPAPALPSWLPTAGAIVPGTQWKLEEKLGQGSVGEVWTGIHEQLHERRVFKFCDTEDKVRTLKRELTIFRLLKERVGQNPHFIRLHEVALEEPPWYLIMDFTEARDLDAWSQGRRASQAEIAVETCIEIVAQTAEGLQAAHEAGILHRDLKPANLLIAAKPADAALLDGGEALAPSVYVLIADFGIGQIVTDALSLADTHRGFTLTVAGGRQSTLSGTILYLAPEVIEGQPATARSDIYSLGVVLWQLLAGSLTTALDPVHWPSKITDPLLREDLDRCLAGDPQKRWPSAGEFAASLRALPNRRLAAAARERTARQRKNVFRGAALIAAVGAALFFAFWFRDARATKARQIIEKSNSALRSLTAIDRRSEGLSWLEQAAKLHGNAEEIRSLGAGFFSLTDLQAATPPKDRSEQPQPLKGGEVVRVSSPSGRIAALGRKADNAQGSIEFSDPTGQIPPMKFRREAFPFVPIPEPGLIQFSPDEHFLAIAGPETSRHILICSTEHAALQTYIFAPERLRCFAWHTGSRLLASGGGDRIISIWDIYSGRDPRLGAEQKNDFDLPPILSEPAVDYPILQLKGGRDSICSIAFNSDGTWLAALDQAGWLRLWSGFTSDGVPGLPTPASAPFFNTGQKIKPPILQLETRLDRSSPEGRINFDKDKVVVRYPGKSPLAFTLESGGFLQETWVASGLRRMAWSELGSKICAITATDVYWISRQNSHGSIQRYFGANAVGAAYDPKRTAWALPTAGSFLERPLPESNSTSAKESQAGYFHSLEAATKRQGSDCALASTQDDRMAVYYGNRLQFFTAGEPDLKTTAINVGRTGGIFDDLFWDHAGKLLTVVYTAENRRRAECYLTQEKATVPLNSVVSNAQRFASAEDGIHLIERSVETGISRVDATTGVRQPLDSSAAACQDAPLAVSADGKWIAAVADHNVVRLIDADSGAHYSDFPVLRDTTITFLAWHPSGRWLAALTDDGYVAVWTLAPWQDWLAKNRLTK